MFRARPFPVFALALGLFSALGTRLSADNDWLGIEVPRPMDSGTFTLDVRLDEAARQSWEDGQHWYYMVDQYHNVMIQNIITIDTRLDWQLSRRLVLEADVPVVFNEFYPIVDGGENYFSVGTPEVSQSQGIGDIRLGLRGMLNAKPEGFNAGWIASLVGPSGLGPFQAPSTMAATGAGRWQLLPGFVVGGLSGSWEAWVQCVGRIQFGQTAVSSSQTYLDWQGQATPGYPLSEGIPTVGVPNNFSLPTGTVWLGPRYGEDVVAGLAWIWYRDQTSRVSTGVECAQHWLSPWTTGAGPIGLPPEESVVFTPEVQARFGRYSALMGWQLKYLWAQGLPAPSYGDLLFDAAYTF
jgi:hypothetical protein